MIYLFIIDYDNYIKTLQKNQKNRIVYIYQSNIYLWLAQSLGNIIKFSILNNKSS